MSVFGGIITGLVTSLLHNKFYNIQLPQVIGFFSGSRFVPIVTSLAMAVVGAVLAFAWPVVQDGISVVAELVKNAGFIGTFLYGTDVYKRQGKSHTVNENIKINNVISNNDLFWALFLKQ